MRLAQWVYMSTQPPISIHDKDLALSLIESAPMNNDAVLKMYYDTCARSHRFGGAFRRQRGGHRPAKLSAEHATSEFSCGDSGADSWIRDPNGALKMSDNDWHWTSVQPGDPEEGPVMSFASCAFSFIEIPADTDTDTYLYRRDQVPVMYITEAAADERSSDRELDLSLAVLHAVSLSMHVSGLIPLMGIVSLPMSGQAESDLSRIFGGIGKNVRIPVPAGSTQPVFVRMVGGAEVDRNKQ